MDAHLLSETIQNIRLDEGHLKDRRLLHENYEWLEHFWRYKYNNGNASIDSFIREKGLFYWGLENIKGLAREFASIECVGSNENPDNAQTKEIAKATMYLRYYCNLFVEEIPSCTSIICREHKIGNHYCTQENGRFWKNSFNTISAFRALIFIVRQVRNNLFHGHKLSLEPEQYSRNKILVQLSAEVTDILLTNLIASGG